jgi:periplasmic divalent cation tolerance protein
MGKKRNVPIFIVLVTCPSLTVARRLARQLVRRRLAACVNVLPGVESVFWWRGEPERCREVLLLIKTTAGSFERLRRAVVELHPYEVPEIIALPLAAGHQPYLRWVDSSLRAQ